MQSVGRCAQLACIWEATARKPGNVHRYRDFDDLTYVDFLLSAVACAPVLERASQQRVGQTVLDGVRATREVVRTNTNLGILLLLAPLASVSSLVELRTGVREILSRFDVEDARLAYQAIRLANPGGLDRVPDQDVQEEPTQTLRQVMALAAERDLIARQYVNDFAQVFEEGVPALQTALESGATLEGAIIACQLTLLALYPDSLIARKRGFAVAEEASRRAQVVLDAGWRTGAGDGDRLGQLDNWLRETGHARNPGTTADLVTACLFVCIRQDRLDSLRTFMLPGDQISITSGGGKKNHHFCNSPRVET